MTAEADQLRDSQMILQSLLFIKIDPGDIANYKLIPILTVFSKVTEKIVFNRMYYFLTKLETLTNINTHFE